MKSSSRRGRSERSNSSSGSSSGIWTRSSWTELMTVPSRSSAPAELPRETPSGGSLSSPGGPQCVGDQVLRRLAVGAVEQLVDLAGAVAETDQSVAGQCPRIVAAGYRDRTLGELDPDLL